MSGTWQALNAFLTPPAPFNVGVMLLLTDGRVMAHSPGTPDWAALSPDDSGSYHSGIWSKLAPLPNSKNIPKSKGGPTYAPTFFSSAVLADGTVFVAGGEYNNNATNGTPEVLVAMRYDPDADAWTELPLPPGFDAIGDAPTCVLSDGRLLMGSNDSNSTAIYDPNENTWTAAGQRAAGTTSSEETWTLLPDGAVLTVLCSGGGTLKTAYKYIPTKDEWVAEADTSNVLPLNCNDGNIPEIGPALLLPDGRVFVIGATGATALYTLPAGSTLAAPSTANGSWQAGPSMVDAQGNTWLPNDVPGVLNIDGTVLCLGGAGPPCTANNLSPSKFFLFDPTANTLKESAQPSTANAFCEFFLMLLLPTGEVLLSNRSNSIQVFTPSGSPNNAWRPVITECPSTIGPPIGPLGAGAIISGFNFNGFSQACSYGDDAQMATNYPLVRIQHNATGKVVYCKTLNHSTMAVATTAQPQLATSTQFNLPENTLPGMHNLFVVANGIPSAPQSVFVLGGLVMAWTGTDNHLNTEIYSGDASQVYDKQIYGEKSNNGPVVLMNADVPVLAWTGTNSKLNVAQWSGIAIDSPKVTLPWTSPYAPALTVFNGRLIIAFVGSGNALTVADITGILAPGFQTPTTTTLSSFVTAGSAPSLCVFGAQLYLAWTDSNRNLQIITSTNAVNFTSTPATGQQALGGPSLASWGGTLWLAWTGTDTDLNLLAYAGASESLPKFVSKEASHVGPALCADIQGGVLHYAWTGTDNHLNLVTTVHAESFGPKTISPEKSHQSPALMLATVDLPGA